MAIIYKVNSTKSLIVVLARRRPRVTLKPLAI